VILSITTTAVSRADKGVVVIDGMTEFQERLLRRNGGKSRRLNPPAKKPVVG
jgi:hypothetical protein